MTKRPGLAARNGAVQAALNAAKTTAPPPATMAKEILEESKPKAKPVGLTVRLDPATHEELRRIAFNERVSIHALLLEGIDLVLKNRHGI